MSTVLQQTTRLPLHSSSTTKLMSTVRLAPGDSLWFERPFVSMDTCVMCVIMIVKCDDDNSSRVIITHHRYYSSYIVHTMIDYYRHWNNHLHSHKMYYSCVTSTTYNPLCSPCMFPVLQCEYEQVKNQGWCPLSTTPQCTVHAAD